MLSRIAPVTCRQDVLDAIRTAARERCSMIRLQRCELTAIRAAAARCEDELVPLRRCESALRGEPQSTVLVGLRTYDSRVGAVVSRDAPLHPFRVARVVGRVLGTMRLGMPLAPSLHCGARRVGVATHPVASIGASLFRVSVRHHFVLPNAASRCNRTRIREHPDLSPGDLLREKDSNLRPSGYEPDELPLLHPANVILHRSRDERIERKRALAARQRDPKKSANHLCTRDGAGARTTTAGVPASC